MLRPVETANGPFVLSFVRDVSFQRMAQDALRRSDQQLRSIVDSVKDYAIFLLDSNGYVATWNPGAQRIKGYTADEIIGQHFSVFYPDDDSERRKPDERLKLARDKGRFEAEGWRIRKDGSRFWANVVITPIYDGHNELTGFAKITRDFTDRKRAEEALMLQLGTVCWPMWISARCFRQFPPVFATLCHMIARPWRYAIRIGRIAGAVS